MTDRIYIVDPNTKKLTCVEAVSFSEIGVKERQDLESWVLDNPGVLGEELLIVTSEFDQFDQSSKRLDVIALDRDGRHVVVELKLDLSGSFADQQAIRYAAMVSTMTMDDIVDALALYEGCSNLQARERIQTFLKRADLPELDNRPRIILAAGSLDDQELTSTVLWLRTFGVDISCVEMTPYRLPTNTLILAPRILIPLPEAKQYVIGVEKKESAAAQKQQDHAWLDALWTKIAEVWAGFELPFKPTLRSNRGHMKIPVGIGAVHYEWLPLKTANCLRVALHLEDAKREKNLERLRAIEGAVAKIAAGVPHPFFAEPWGKHWATAEFRVPWAESQPLEEIGAEAARTMKVLVDRTWPIVKEFKVN